MLKTNLHRLSKQWEAKSLLINIANQLDAGVAGPDEFAPFFKKYNTVSADCSGWSGALNDDLATSYDPEKMFFLGGDVTARKKNDFLLVRIAPMASILSGVDLDDGKRKTQIHRLLKQCSQLSISNPEFATREKLLRGFLFPRGETIPSSWNLPDSIGPLTLAKLIGNAINLRDHTGYPVFLAPFIDGGGLSLLFSHHTPQPADIFRDWLGLDHLSATRKGSRVILGYYVFRFSQIENGKIHRPTPFDGTSSGRFRGCHGSPGKATGVMGRTANLAAIDQKSAKIEGVSEVVCANELLKPGRQEILVGYLGQVLEPRKDGYVPSQSENNRDKHFQRCSIGGRGINDVIDRLYAAAHIAGVVS